MTRKPKAQKCPLCGASVEPFPERISGEWLAACDDIDCEMCKPFSVGVWNRLRVVKRKGKA